MNGGSAPRVLFWSEYYWPYIGGPEIMAARLLPALRDRGFRFTVLTSQHQLDLPSEDEVDGIPILRIPFRGPIERGEAGGSGAGARGPPGDGGGRRNEATANPAELAGGAGSLLGLVARAGRSSRAARS